MTSPGRSSAAIGAVVLALLGGCENAVVEVRVCVVRGDVRFLDA